MIQLSDRDYKSLLEARNAMAAALRQLVDATDSPGDDALPKQAQSVIENERSEAVAVARGLLEKYGEHQAFILSEQPEPQGFFRRLLSN
ncbi:MULTISPECIES: hypothetical protein [Paraburkholderia]|uniref:Uncharacterized protein n=1 Tax=Paraburkholderia madseniana TaxID=2599607 RepID=A0AAP5ESZ2_9BURK|nr:MULTISPECIES: hypothetical protein [Paraburkholderia]MCX4151987.1 hypothetical protein [Paraburkholderia madseniana]MCX4175594.1 hypothetical protein [Paraburkholderia madseniana]MDN7154915.1 hypothetical protein [Paraburkholderia sp. WS6]MDQ6413798.1 hypothetical protein [Paraburkholderia madseniana]MDQ6463590.1 hypothetical protein [Paraburkholderia madseniana]